MTYVMDHPLLVFAVSFFGLSLSALIGGALSKRQRLTDIEDREGLGIIQAATLTLLGLVIGFSFSMAVGRYDQRKNYEESEANAIGTEYFRAGLLPSADAVKVRALLLNYLDQRVVFYETSDEEQFSRNNALTGKLQAELWSVVRTPSVEQPGPVVALAVSGMNDVFNSQGFTQAAWWNRIPIAAWALMAVIAACANAMVGFCTRAYKAKTVRLLILPLVVSVAFLLIADIDGPHGGLIKVTPQNLLSLAQSLHAR